MSTTVTEVATAPSTTGAADIPAVLTFKTDCWDVSERFDNGCDFEALGVQYSLRFLLVHLSGAIKLPRAKMIALIKHGFKMALVLTISAMPCVAQETETGPGRYVIAMRGIDPHPKTSDRARRTLARLGDAASTVCGASEVSLRELKLAVKRSSCWRDSMEDVVRRINDPLLSQTWQKNR